jgi:hypothetical protein
MNTDLETTLREAVPVRAMLITPKGNHEFTAKDCEVPNLRSLEGVIDQGFDPEGPVGPTYWRRTSSRYYSTIATAKGVVLSITVLPDSARVKLH